MSGFLDLLDPRKVTQRSIDTIKAPFQGRDDHPWAQATARNFGHAAFGDAIGKYVDTKMLGDTPNGYRYAQNDPSMAQQGTQWDALLGQNPVAPARAQAQTSSVQQIDPQMILKLLMSRNGAM